MKKIEKLREVLEGIHSIYDFSDVVELVEQIRKELRFKLDLSDEAIVDIIADVVTLPDSSLMLTDYVVSALVGTLLELSQNKRLVLYLLINKPFEKLNNSTVLHYLKQRNLKRPLRKIMDQAWELLKFDATGPLLELERRFSIRLGGVL